MSMPQAVHLIAQNVPSCGVPEGRCLTCSGFSGRTSVVYSRSCCRVHSHVKGLKSVSVGASFVCEARKNPDFSRQNKHRFSRNRNRHNEERESREGFENLQEDMLSSKNGPLVSLTNNSKSSATAAPGAREKEIVELFRKVQAQLRERAATKEEKKVEASQGQGKDNGTVDSLLKLLRKHSAEQVKRRGGSGKGKDFSLEEFQNSDQDHAGQSAKSSDSNIITKDESREVNVSVSRPRSNFHRRSPVHRIKYQPVSHDNDDDDGGDENTIPVGSRAREEYQSQTGLELDAEADFDSEQELDPKNEIFFPHTGIAELSEDDDSHNSELTYNDENGVEENVVHDDDLSALKLPELRALAKSRGLKGFSKMKKVDLVELLSGN